MTIADDAVPSSAIPRIDLHRHLDGNLRLETCLELAHKHGVSLPKEDLAALKPHLQMLEPGPDLPAFLEKVERMASVLGDVDACRRVAYENVQDAARERLHYVELRFSPAFMASAHGLPLETVVEAVVDGVVAGREDFPVQVQLIGILSRTFGPDSAKKELESLLSHKKAIAALDLIFPASPSRSSSETFSMRGKLCSWRAARAATTSAHSPMGSIRRASSPTSSWSCSRPSRSL